MKNEVKAQKGITLIMLVVTIVVILILAGITINLAFDENGIIKRAKGLQEIINQSIANEEEELDKLTNYLNGAYPPDKTSMTLGKVYKDDMIGQKLTYSSNGQSDWIVFGKDNDGNILITTELPIDGAFELYGSAEKWLSYENDLHTACSGYGGMVQGIAVTSRSITMKDINYVAGFTEPTFDTYTFGETQEYDNKQVNYYYPSASASSNAYWQAPSSSNTATFKNNWYYYYNSDGEKYVYSGADTNGNDIDATTRNINTDNCKYIWGGNTEDTCYNEYVVASRFVLVGSGNAYFHVANVGRSGVNTYDWGLCGSDASGGYDYGVFDSVGLRPIVVLPSSLLVELQADGTYDLAEG